MSILMDPHRGREPEISEHKIQAGLAITRKKTKLRYAMIKNMRFKQISPSPGRRQNSEML